MRTVVCVPYRPDTWQRVWNWGRTSVQWEGLPVVMSDSPGDRFSRGLACNRGVEWLGLWDVAIFADSDLLLGDRTRAYDAVAEALETKGYVVPYNVLHYLDEEATSAVRRGWSPGPHMAGKAVGETWGGVFAIHRELWEAVGGFDPRFEGWGGEDVAFFHTVAQLGSVKRLTGDLYHLDHPEAIDYPGLDANYALAERYRAATSPAAIRELLAER